MVAWEVNACVEHSIDNEYFEKLYGETDENFKLQISPNALTLFLNNNKQNQIHFSVYSSILASRNRKIAKVIKAQTTKFAAAWRKMSHVISAKLYSLIIFYSKWFTP